MKFTRLLQSREFIVSLILIGAILLIGAINPSFLKSDSLLAVLNSSLILILISIGEMFVLLTRGIDVSVGAITGLSAVSLGLALNAGIPIPVAIGIALLVGLAGGLFNAVGITYLKVPPIIMTLGSLGIFRGLMLILTDGSWIEQIPQEFKLLAGATLGGVKMFIWITLALAVMITLLTRRMKQARYLYAIGDNEEGAYLLGIPVKAAKFSAYTLAGFFAGAASIIFVAQIGVVPMQAGSGQELRAIAANVLGGVNLAGGVGSPFSAVLGAIFLTVIDSTLIFLKVPGYWNNAVAGAILLIVVLIDYRIRQSLNARQRLERARVKSAKAKHSIEQRNKENQ
jgi:AI-2 transport system permease protein